MDEAMGMEWVERLKAAVDALEALVERQTAAATTAVSASAEEVVGPIVATVASEREAELAEKLAEAERTIEELRASAASAVAAPIVSGRKTVVASTMQAKGFAAGDVAEASAVDAALGSLSLEQRIAVKSEMLRAGLLR